MPLEVERVKETRTKIIPQGVSIVDSWLIDEIRYEVADAIIDENRAQYKQGNVVNKVVIDRRNVKTINPAEAKSIASYDAVRIPELKRQVAFFYTSIGTLIDAFTSTWNRLLSLTPSKTGDARASYEFWVADHTDPSRNTRMHNAAGVVNWLEKSASGDVLVHILGPKVEYRRSVIYRSQGQKTKFISAKDASVNRTKFLKPQSRNLPGYLKSQGKGIVSRATRRRGGIKTEVLVAKAIQEIAISSLKRQYRDIWFSYGFIREHPSALPLPIMNHLPRNKHWVPSGLNAHIPVIYLRVKRSGRFS